MPQRYCGRCHDCRTILKEFSGTEWCSKCNEYKYYWSHGVSKSDIDSPEYWVDNEFCPGSGIEDLTDLEKINKAHEGLGIAARCIELLPVETLGYADSGGRFPFRWPIRDEMLSHILGAREQLRATESALADAEKEGNDD